MDRSSASLVIRSKLQWDSISHLFVCSPKTKRQHTGEEVKRKKHFTHCWEYKLVHPRGRRYGRSSKVKTRTNIPARSHASRIDPRKRNQDQEEIPALHVHWYIITAAETWKKPSGLLMEEQIRELWRVTWWNMFIPVLLLYNVEFLSTVWQGLSALQVHSSTPIRDPPPPRPVGHHRALSTVPCGLQ